MWRNVSAKKVGILLERKVRYYIKMDAFLITLSV